MKKTFAGLIVLAAVAFNITGFAVEESAALSTAQALVGQDSVLTETERDDGNYEFEFTDSTANIRYDVVVNEGSGAVHKLETEYRNVNKSSTAVLDEAAARAIVAEARPEAVLQYALLEEDDGRYAWDVFYTEGTTLGIYSIQAETGEVLDTEVYYDVPETVMTVSEALEALVTAKGSVTELELEFEFDEHGYCYDGKVQDAGGAIYEFELNAVDGTVIEWEIDD